MQSEMCQLQDLNGLSDRHSNSVSTNNNSSENEEYVDEDVQPVNDFESREITGFVKSPPLVQTTSNAHAKQAILESTEPPIDYIEAAMDAKQEVSKKDGFMEELYDQLDVSMTESNLEKQSVSDFSFLRSRRNVQTDVPTPGMLFL